MHTSALQAHKLHGQIQEHASDLIATLAPYCGWSPPVELRDQLGAIALWAL
jgi:hypothetical protein